MNRIIKKLSLIGISLFLLANVSTNSVSAHHKGYHYHYYTTRVRHHNKYLSFYRLIKDMNYDQDNNASTYTNQIFNTVKHNLNHYSEHQLYEIGSNPDYQDLETSNNNFVLEQDVMNRYYNRKYSLAKLSQQDTPYDTRIRQAMIDDINNTREDYGLNPLKVTSIAQMTANYRAPYVQYAYDHLSDYTKYNTDNSSNDFVTFNPTDNWVHGNITHTTNDQYLSNHNYDYNDCGENASNFGEQYNKNSDGTPQKYNGITPQDIAGNQNDDTMNHDMGEGNNNSHRKNELDPSWKYLGVGVSYNPQTQQGSINEQFIG